MRTGSIQLFRILGVRVGVDASWFVVLFLFIFLVSGTFRDKLDVSDTVAFGTAVASVLLFFGSLILHELGHAVAARRQGIGIAGIDLFVFGGVAKMTSDTRSPGGEFKVAVAGPLVTLLIVGLCTGVGVLAAGADGFADASPFEGDVSSSPALVLLHWLAFINAGLFVFNLVPAFPLDGGRIARAVAWRVTGDRTRATRLAAALGQGFSWLLIAFGVYALIDGATVTGLWSIVLGWFLSSAARGAVVQSAFSDRIGDVTVADIMDREPVSIPADMPVTRALDEYFLRYRWPWFPVIDPVGRFVGLVQQPRVEGPGRAGDGTVVVRDVMDAGDPEWRIAETAPVESLLASEPLRRLGALMAVDGDGVLRGVVTLEQLRRALQQAAAPPTA